MSIANAMTIGDFISEYQNLQIKESIFYTKGDLSDNIRKYITLDENWINSYNARLDTYKVKQTLTPEKFARYKYNPALLSLDLYESTEYAWLILHANEMNSENEFNQRTIYIYRSNVIDFINEILIVNDDIIDSNQTEIYNLKQEELLNSL